MAKFDTSSLRNTALVGHSSCGKTILTEAMLFNSNVVNRMGRVEDGTTVMDFEPEETKRIKSLGTSCAAFEWKKQPFFVMDTPGDGNFFADTFLALEAADSAVLVVEAIDGVKVQTEKAWQRASELGLPVIGFINKMDRERADYFKTVEDLESILGIKPLVLQMPLGSEEDFKGVVDLVTMKAYMYADDGSGKFQTQDMPADIQDRANELRETLIEDIAEVDDALVEKYLDEGALSDEEMLQGLIKGVHSAGFIPIFCGSAIRNVGVVHLLQGVLDLLPSPLSRPEKEGVHPETGEKVTRKPSPDEPFSALVFKTLSDPYAGKLSIFRVFSGTLSADMSPLNASRGVKERLGQIVLLRGKTQTPVDSVGPGAVAAVAKLKETRTGDTLSNDKNPVRFDLHPLPPTIIAYAIEPKTREDEDKVMSSLQRLMEQDPMLRLSRDEQTRDIMIEGMGRSHLEVTVDRLRNKFGIEVNLKTPKIPYRETVKGERKGVIYRHKKQTGGRGQFAEVHFDVSALPRGEGHEFEEALTGMNVPRNFVPAVEKGVQEALRSGPLAGYPVSDVKVRFYDGKSHDVDSSDMAFKIAASMCLKKAVEEAGPVLLEPIVTTEVVVPEENMGDIIGDLNSRRGRVLGMEDRGNAKVIKAQVPYAEVLMYEPDLTSMTSGRGSFTMEFSHYEEVPQHLTDRIVQQTKAESGGS